MPSNQKILWDDRYTLDIDIIDEQHKKLFDLVNRLYDLDDDNFTKQELRTILYEFSDYMDTHFKEEEEYMESIGYDKLQEHTQLHKELIDALAHIVHTPAKLPILKTKMRVYSMRALVDHITHEDTKIKVFELEKENYFDITDL